MAKKNYDELATKVVDLVGGKENISYFTHCITRLRFNVKDKGLVKEDQIKKISHVVGCQWSGDQLQIIIGQNVNEAYQLICTMNGLKEEDSINENLDKETDKKKFNIKKILLVIVDCMAPLFPMLIGSSLLKAVCILISTAGWVEETNMTYQFFYNAAEAGMYYFPVFLGATAAKRFGANLGLGMLMGAMLLHPNIQGLLNSGESLTLLGLPVTTQYVYYSNSIVPAILMVWVMSHIEKFFKKHLPSVIKSMLTPFLTLVIMIPLGFIVLGPAAAIVGAGFSGLINGIYNTLGPIAVAGLTAAFPWIISTGMHSAVLPPYYMWALSTMGYDPISKPAAFLTNMTMGAAGIAIAIKMKKADSKSVAFSSGLSSILTGVSEPVLFGVDLKYSKCMIAATIGGAVGGLIVGFAGVKGYAGQNSLLGLVTFALGGKNNLIWMVVAVIASIAVTFIMTLFMYKGESIDD